VHESLKSSRHCIEAVKSANKIGMISRTFMCKIKNKETMLQIYKSLVRPKLEYTTVFIHGGLIFIKILNFQRSLEKVQRRATRTRLMFSDKSLGYYDRLRKLGLTTVETLILRGDIIKVFKIFKGFEDVSYNLLYFVTVRTPWPFI